MIVGSVGFSFFCVFAVCFRFVLLRDIMYTTGLPANLECLKSSTVNFGLTSSVGG